MPSPAQRYAASRRRGGQAARIAEEFISGLGFEPDTFQRDAIDAVAAGSGVLVAAPTGAGKTVVGEFAVELALQTGRKAFYTTPIKALSNQKYHDLVARHGAAMVGLLTGDNSINGEAPVVVMTTEVLRNMMYADSSTLTDLGFVVMDEVHYLADRFRGAVWEEVIIHLPQSVQVISLSATVSNAEEFGDWLRTVRGGSRDRYDDAGSASERGYEPAHDTMAVIVSEHRPIPLWQHLMVGQDLYDLFATAPGEEISGINPELLRRIGELDRASRWSREDYGAPRGRRGRSTPPPRHRPDHRRQPQAGGGSGRANPGALPGGTASRAQVIEQLDRAGLLPAITFIFSRVGCEAAVSQLLSRGLRLVPPDEARRVRQLVETRVTDIPPEDLAVLGYHDFVEGLTRGFAAHHAGMLPLFREVVEELFAGGSLRAVFATETLALGINMPARSVVLEKLVKFNGDVHAPVTPAEYTQLTGRAGRRGIDIEGHAVVLHRRGVDPEEVAGLASTRTYPLRSSFRPTYNMAVNLVARFGWDRAQELLQASFAQFQADRAVVGISASLRRNTEALAGYAESMHCDRGDFTEYAKIRYRLSELEKAASKRRGRARRAAAAAAVDGLRSGQVLLIRGGRRDRNQHAVVIPVHPKQAKGMSSNGRVTVLALDGRIQSVGPEDLAAPVVPEARIDIPRHFNARSPRSRKDLGSSLRAALSSLPRSGADELGEDDAPEDLADLSGAAGEDRSAAADRAEIESLRSQLRSHPCHDCPDREDHARWSERAWSLRRENDDLQRRISARTGTVARTFRRICRVLAELGYLSADSTTVTPAGERLRHLYSERDLITAECLRRGTWNHLDAPNLAAAVSALVHEPRGADQASEPRIPTGDFDAAYHEMIAVTREIRSLEIEHRLPEAAELDPGIAWAMHRWASGKGLAEVLDQGTLTAGDFVRRCKQVIDLLGQIGHAAGPTSPVADTAARAARALLRGVVASDRVD